MGDADDFTFCQVASQVDDEVLSLPDSIPNINTISLNDSAVNGKTEWTIDASVSRTAIPKNSGGGGSQSNKLNDESPQKIEADISPTQIAEEQIGDSLNGSLEQKLASKKPIVRSKVPFEKGYSQMDWLKLTRTEPDLAGLKGQTSRRFISMEEVRKHKTEGSIWTVLKGRVYNISPYMKFHPGGVDMLMKAAGKDCTSLFNKYHAWVNAEFLLEKCLVGILDEN